MSRRTTAAVYRKLLDDPAALQQFTEQAIQKFGPERLSHMVAPQLQEIIVNEAFAQMSTGALANALKEHNRWTEVLEYAFETEQEWVLDHFGLRDQINAAYDSGLAEGQEQANESQIQEAYNEGFEDGRKASS